MVGLLAPWVPTYAYLFSFRDSTSMSMCDDEAMAKGLCVCHTDEPFFLSYFDWVGLAGSPHPCKAEEWYPWWSEANIRTRDRWIPFYC